MVACLGKCLLLGGPESNNSSHTYNSISLLASNSAACYVINMDSAHLLAKMGERRRFEGKELRKRILFFKKHKGI